MKTIVLLSGGMDSAVLLWHLIRQGDECRTLAIDYGQRHARELLAAKTLSHLAGVRAVEHREINLSCLRPLLRGSSQTDMSNVDVPEGHYAEESMKLTVVPNRNMILLGVAGAWAVSTKSDCISYAAHTGDHTIYPDCRPEFVNAMHEALRLCDWHPVKLLRPFIHKSKADLVAMGTVLGVPFKETWTCYKGGELACGKCGSCSERLEAFKVNCIPDPVEYES